MKFVGPALLLASALGMAAFARRKKKPAKSTKPVIKVPEPYQYIVYENQEYEIKVSYRIDFTQMPGGIRWRVFGAGTIDAAGELVNAKATPLASGTAANPDAARSDAINWIKGQKPESVAYQADGHKVIQQPQRGYLLTVTFDPELMFHKGAQDTEGFELVASTPSSFTFQLTQPLVPLDVRDVYVQMSDGGLLLGQYRVSVLG
jgi:hypothetical protein